MSAMQPEHNRTRKTLTWVLVGLGVIVSVQLCLLAAVLVFSPTARARLFGGATVAAPPEAPQRLAAASAPTLISDNFDQPTDRWDQSAARIVDGTYELRVDIPNYDSYGLLLNQDAISNFDMAVDAQQITGDPTSEYGIRFRQSGPNEYLMFSISGSGYYRLVRVSNGEYTSLVPWTFDRRVKTGSSAVNRLRVVADGATMMGYVNDAKLVETKDTIQQAGQLTLDATTFTKGGLAVRFDNIVGQARGITLNEDFSDPAKVQWSVGGAQIVDGTYEISSSGGVQTWQQPLPFGASAVQNFKLDVDATLIHGDGQNGAAYGVIFGDDGAFNFYMLYLLPDGGISIVRHQANQAPIPVIEPSASDAIKKNTGASNHIEIELHTDILTISINDTSLGEIKLDTPPRGSVGLAATSHTDSVQVRFDNFRLEPLQ